jgi:hypothetical protein
MSASKLNPNAQSFIPASVLAEMVEEAEAEMAEIEAYWDAEALADEMLADHEAQHADDSDEDTDEATDEAADEDVPVVARVEPTPPIASRPAMLRSCYNGAQCRGYENGRCPFEHKCRFVGRCNRADCKYAH